MSNALQIVTDRMVLRAWNERDRNAFATINSDPFVMRFFPAPLSEQESDEAMERYNRQLDRDGFSMFAATDRHSGELLGLLGAQTMRFAVPNLPQPAVEVGWRLGASAHGRGFATEGAQAVLRFLRTLGINDVVAITTPANEPSRNVMRKLGMTHRPELTFMHPSIPAASPACEHVLYSLELRGPGEEKEHR